MNGNDKIAKIGGEKSLSAREESILVDLYDLSGKILLNRILNYENPRHFVQHLSQIDFFWLVKKVGENDCLPLLELASDDQWQYLLDLEIWRKDLPDPVQIFNWLARLHQAAPGRLSRWLLQEGQDLACYSFFKGIEVYVKENEDEIFDLRDGFITLDGLFYFRPRYEEQREAIEDILRKMAGDDLARYQGFLLALSSILPAEIEEEMYRLRNVRLAEHGFLPHEEAVAAYAPLNTDILRVEQLSTHQGTPVDYEIHAPAPKLPLCNAGEHDLLTQAFSKTDDPLFVDRIRLEFAGLCNQILSADGIVLNEVDVLIKTCQKVAGYLNLAVERLCGLDIQSAESLLVNNSLVSIFRAGFGLALELKWKVERWLKESWFYGVGLTFSFWGDEWGTTLKGLAKKKPLFYTGLVGEEAYKDFDSNSELESCQRTIDRLTVLDRLMGRLGQAFLRDETLVQDPDATFYSFLFDLWARQILNMEPCFEGISSEQWDEFFHILRAGRSGPPYTMSGFEEMFVSAFIAYVPDLEPVAMTTLRDTLSLVWRQFSEEFELVSIGDLDGRFTKFIRIKPSSKNSAL